MRNTILLALALCLGAIGRAYCQAPPPFPPVPPLQVTPVPPPPSGSILVIRIAPRAVRQSVQAGLLEIIEPERAEPSLRGMRVVPLPVEPMGLRVLPPLPPPAWQRQAQMEKRARRDWAERLNRALEEPLR